MTAETSAQHANVGRSASDGSSLEALTAPSSYDSDWRQMHQLRGEFWSYLHRIPFVQEQRIKDLLAAVDRGVISREVFETHGSASLRDEGRLSSEQSLAVLAAYVPTLTENLEALTSNPIPRLIIANSYILNQFPMPPERALLVSKKVEQKWLALVDCKQKLHEEFGEEMRGCASNDPRLVRLKRLQKDLGIGGHEGTSTIEKMLEARDGYIELRDEKYFENERLIWTSTGNLNRRMKLPDLRQEASRGLLYAIERFRDRGTKFSTYAIRAIQTFSGRGSFNSEASAVEIPIHLRPLFRHMKSMVRSEPNVMPQDVISRGDVSEEIARALLVARRPVEQPSESVLDDKISMPEDVAHNADLWRVFEKALGALTDRECRVVLQRAGLYEDALTLEDIAKSMNPPVTRERVRQIEEKAMKKIKAIMRKKFPMEIGRSEYKHDITYRK